ncbi:pseudaminic acid synthase [Arthrobacter sp. ISL-28]|uniref:pseudaminic acid synthase n=1 Tax=Arthrobacter sp. ISL-28 TaxID=2819108 RepID=UPI001BEA3681|nr:pseudaminic acid synthase [Arthrobacter sp. ISL-28]MBT2519667.1 pseudaminic acid synthase [Arthrobacter sp. ISL-28]
MDERFKLVNKMTENLWLREDVPPLIVAEMSGNHNGDLQRALDIIDAVADSGAGAIKFQTYTADTITLDCDLPRFRISASHPLWGGKNLHALYEEAHTPWSWHERLFSRARDRGLIPFSSPFDRTAVDLLEGLGAPMYKIASLEIGDVDLLRRVAQTGKPVILSNGAATLEDLDLAVRTIRDEGNNDIVILCCTSSYPADPSESNLRGLPVLADLFGVRAGLSDHTQGIGAAIAASALGARLIEKHVTLSRADGGVDAEFSLEPHELRQLVLETQRAWTSLGSPTFTPTASEAESLRLRRSLCIVKDVREGEELTRQNVRSIRPAGGLEPKLLDVVIGRKFRTDVSRGTALTWDLI